MNTVSKIPEEFLFTSEISVCIPSDNPSDALAQVYELVKPVLKHTAMLVAYSYPSNQSQDSIQVIKILTGRDASEIASTVGEFANINNFSSDAKHHLSTNKYSTTSDYVIRHDKTPLIYQLNQFALERSYAREFSVTQMVEDEVQKKYGGECDVLTYYEHTVTHDVKNMMAFAIVMVQAQDAKSAVLLKLNPF